MNEWTDAPEDILETFCGGHATQHAEVFRLVRGYALVIPKQLREIRGRKAGRSLTSVRTSTRSTGSSARLGHGRQGRYRAW